MRLILVEDDQQLAAITAEYLQRFGYSVDIEYRGDTAPARILAGNYEIAILDLILPGLDGLEICRQIRPHFKGQIVMLTAMSDDVDQVLGLELGADDYIPKPVPPRLLLARLRALARRNHPEPAGESDHSLRFGQLAISQSTRSVILGEHEVLLTTAEFDLLWLLASHAGSVVTRDDLMEQLRGIDYDGVDRSMNVRISRLRKKLGDDAEQPQRIKTIRGKGYLFSLSDWG